MNIPLSHNQISPLRDIGAYAGSEVLDLRVALPWSQTNRRRVPLHTHRSSSIVEAHQLRIYGTEPAECQTACLVIAQNHEVELDGLSVSEAEERLWKLARGHTRSAKLTSSRVDVRQPIGFHVSCTAGPQGSPERELAERFGVSRGPLLEV